MTLPRLRHRVDGAGVYRQAQAQRYREHKGVQNESTMSSFSQSNFENRVRSIHGLSGVDFLTIREVDLIDEFGVSITYTIFTLINTQDELAALHSLTSEEPDAAAAVARLVLHGGGDGGADGQRAVEDGGGEHGGEGAFQESILRVVWRRRRFVQRRLEPRGARQAHPK